MSIQKLPWIDLDMGMEDPRPQLYAKAPNTLGIDLHELKLG